MTKAAPLLTFVVLTLFPEMHDQPVRSGRTRHSSPKRHGSILHHHFWRTIEAVEKGSAKGHFKQTKMWESIIRFYTPRSLTTRVTWAGGDDATLTNAQQKCWLQRGQNGAPVTLPSTQEGRALVVPATCPGKQEHLTVWERSSILFLLQQRWAATTSHVPVLSCSGPEGHKLAEKGPFWGESILHIV